MPDFPDIVYLRQPRGARVNSFATASNETDIPGVFSISGRPSGTRGAYGVFETFGELEDYLLANQTPDIVFQVPYNYRDGGVVLDISANLIALNAEDPAVDRITELTFRDAVPATRTEPVADFNLVFTEAAINNLRTTTQLGVFATKITDPPSGWSARFPTDSTARALYRAERIAGTGVNVTLRGRNAPELMPQIPGAVETPIWCRIGDTFGDFAALALDGQDVLQSVASKAVTVTTSYQPELEDLDNTIRFGTDSRGAPIIWRILSTTRSDRFIDLQLTAAAV